MKNNSIAKYLVNNKYFNNFTLIIVLINTILIGVSTYIPNAQVLHNIEYWCVLIYLIEIIIRFTGRSSSKEYFSSGWNWFDIFIVASSFIPASMFSLAPVLRVFRIFKLCGKVKELNILVNVLFRSIKSLTFISLLMGIFFYVYAVIGVSLFGEVQPENFGTLHEACFTLFQNVVGDDFGNMRNKTLELYNNWTVVTLYYTSWLGIGAFVLLNLVIGAIGNNFDEVREEIKLAKIHADGIVSLDEEILLASEKLNTLLKEKQNKVGL